MKKILFVCSLLLCLFTAKAQPDLWTRDDGSDVGVEPYTGGIHYASPDIWVRNANDAGTTDEPALSNQWNYVHVRVRNRGTTFTPNASTKVFVYWGKAGVYSSWPDHWDASTPICNPGTFLGAFIGSQPVTNIINTGGEQILVFPWWPPNPSDYACILNDAVTHFCLLSRIQTDNNPPFGMSTPEGNVIVDNILYNNNISMRNITVIDLTPGAPPGTGTILMGGTQLHKVPTNFHRLRFTVPVAEQQDPLHKHARIIVDLGQFTNRWIANGAKGEGIRVVTGGPYGKRVELLNANATIDNLKVDPAELGAITVEMTYTQAPNREIYNLNMAYVADNGKVINGEIFQARFRQSTKPKVVAEAKPVEANSSFTATAANGLLTVRVNDSKPYTLELADANGRPMTTKKFNNQTQVPVSTYAPGVYLVRLTPTAGGEAQVKKVIIGN